MADFAPPSGPPPPKVPAGWTARWNDQYSEWYYVNIYTKKSQWDKPTEPVYPHPSGDDHDAPGGPPPGYAGTGAGHGGDEKHAYSSNNPYGTAPGAAGASQQVPYDLNEDEKLARKLQEEEDARNRGASDSYYGQQQGGSYGQGVGGVQQGQYGQELPPRETKKSGFLGKLSSKLGGGSSSHRPQQYGGGYPQQGYGGGMRPGYGQPMGYGQQPYGMPQQGYYGGGYQQPPRRTGGGMGPMGGAALGLGGGLLGGMMLGEAMDSGDGGGDYGGGGDDGGGDMGGDGGGDGGGGDF